MNTALILTIMLSIPATIIIVSRVYNKKVKIPVDLEQSEGAKEMIIDAIIGCIHWEQINRCRNMIILYATKFKNKIPEFDLKRNVRFMKITLQVRINFLNKQEISEEDFINQQ